MLRKSLGLALGLYMLAFVAHSAVTGVRAEETAEDPAVATVNGQAILRSQVLAAASRLPQEYQQQLALIYPMLVERLVDMKVVALAAADAGLGDDEEVQALLAQRKEEIMRDVYLERLIADQITDDRLQEAYDSFLVENPPSTEVKARHILLENEADARDVIVELEGGADFAELAKERSTGPSSVKGGDLGFFTKDQMVPEFAEAAFAQEPGSHSADPVQTQFGWHVILVEERRTSDPPAFEDVQVELQNNLSRTIVQERVDALRADAEVEVIDAAAQAAPPAEAPAEGGESGSQ